MVVGEVEVTGNCTKDINRSVESSSKLVLKTSFSPPKHLNYGTLSSTTHPQSLPLPSIAPVTIQNGNQHWIGLPLAVLSAMAFSFNALIAKMLSHLNPFNLGIWTFLFMNVVSVIAISHELIVKQNIEIIDSLLFSSEHRFKRLIFLFIRAFTGAFTLVLFYCALKYLNVADAIVIHASSPIFVYLLAFLFLGESFGVVPCITTLLVFVGVVLITRPPILTGSIEAYNVNILIGVVLAFLSMLCIALAITILRLLNNVHHTVITFTLSFFGASTCLIISVFNQSVEFPSDPQDIFKIILSGAMFYIAQLFVTLAVQFENAGPVGLLRTTEVLFVFLWQFIFLGLAPDVFSVSGAVLVISGAVLTIARKWMASLPVENYFRRSCQILLR